MIARGKTLLPTLKILAKEALKFGLPGQEIRDGLSRKPVLPSKGTIVDDKLISDYEVTPDGTRLSREGHADFVYDRDVVTKSLDKYHVDASALLQWLLEHLSIESSAVLDLCVGRGGFEDLVSNCDTLGLWMLILQTHQGSSGRAKQGSLQEFLQWTQRPDLSVAQNFANFQTLCAAVTANFETKAHPGHLPLEALFRMCLLLGLNQKDFQREIENAYDQDIDKTATEIMEKCLIVYQERGGRDSTSYNPAALLTSTSTSSTRVANLGPYPPGGDPQFSTCPFCHSH